MKKGAKELGHILLSKDHPGCTFFESPEKTILVVINLDAVDLAVQAEEILKHGYVLSGGIQLIRRDDGRFNGTATFLKVE